MKAHIYTRQKKKRNYFFNRSSFKNNILDLNKFHCITNQINLPCNCHKSRSSVYSISHKIILFTESGDIISTVKSVSGMTPIYCNSTTNSMGHRTYKVVNCLNWNRLPLIL